MKIRTLLLIAFGLFALISVGILAGRKEPSEIYAVDTLLLALPMMAVAIGAGFLASQYIARPIQRLTQDMKKFGNGDLSHRSAASSPRDIADLAQAFNTMADSVSGELDERRRVEAHLDASRKQFRDLSAHLQTVREEERARIARDIHDDLGQWLTMLKLNLSLLHQDTPESALVLREKISEMSSHVDATIRSVQRIISELRPRLLDDLGLTAAIEWQVADFQKRTGIPVALSIYPREVLLDAKRSTVVFRILQEALLNVTRHAQATAVTVSITDIDGTVELTIADNGRGITPEEINDCKSFGLMGIRERAESLGGQATITGTPHEGTAIAVSFSTTDEEAHP